MKKRLLAMAYDMTRDMVSENQSQPLGSPEDVLELLIQDPNFAEVWDDFCDERGWDEEIDDDHPDYRELLEIIGTAQDASEEMHTAERRDRNRTVLGEKLKSLRQQRGLTAYRVSKEGGITITQVKIVEEGINNYTIDIFLGYLRGCGLNLSLED